MRWRDVVADARAGLNPKWFGEWMNCSTCPVGDAVARYGLADHYEVHTSRWLAIFNRLNRVNGETILDGFSARIHWALNTARWDEADRILDEIDDAALAMKREARDV